jgi:hypothetical protein
VSTLVGAKIVLHHLLEGKVPGGSKYYNGMPEQNGSVNIGFVNIQFTVYPAPGYGNVIKRSNGQTPRLRVYPTWVTTKKNL